MTPPGTLRGYVIAVLDQVRFGVRLAMGRTCGRCLKANPGNRI